MSEYDLPPPLTISTFPDYLVDIVKQERSNSRQEDFNERIEADEDAVGDNEPVVRLGTDILEFPEFPDPMELPRRIADQRDGLCFRLGSNFMLKINQLACDASNIESPVPPTLDQQSDLLQSLDTEIRRVLWHAHMMGRGIGMEDGSMFYKGLLGETPSVSRRYPYQDYQPYINEQEDVRMIGITVETPAVRDQRYGDMLQGLEQMLRSLCEELERAVTLKYQQIQSNDVDHQFIVSSRERNLERTLYRIRNLIKRLVNAAYDIGVFDGFEVGQHAMKCCYRHLHCHRDARIYSKLSFQGNAIAVNVGSPLACRCGHCYYCIRGDNQRMDEQWPQQYQEVQDAIEQVQMERAEEHAHTERMNQRGVRTP